METPSVPATDPAGQWRSLGVVDLDHTGLQTGPLARNDRALHALGHVGEPRVVPMKTRRFMPVGPLRCLATIISAVPVSGESGLYTSSR